LVLTRRTGGVACVGFVWRHSSGLYNGVTCVVCSLDEACMHLAATFGDYACSRMPSWRISLACLLPVLFSFSISRHVRLGWDGMHVAFCAAAARPYSSLFYYGLCSCRGSSPTFLQQVLGCGVLDAFSLSSFFACLPFLIFICSFHAVPSLVSFFEEEKGGCVEEGMRRKREK